MNAIVKKTIAALCLGLIPALACADEHACLNDLAGDFQSHTPQAESILSVKPHDNGWTFSLPDDVEYDPGTPFRYHFDREKILEARPVTGDSLQYAGYAMLTPFFEKDIKLDSVKIECGLAVDGIFLVKMDLSRADGKLLKNIAMLNSAMAGKYPAARQSHALGKKLRGVQYFAGASLQLDGVINTITPILVQKSPSARPADSHRQTPAP
ncbi:hypothetical protein [Chromobacterium subtsugae]|uniref:hypothetical protein n=1 Tax=Chromobacterium subtsugae TaxID=251747 RepID=UPI000640EB60|nr:hypothetical protein [Chromobacterium subtsugae]